MTENHILIPSLRYVVLRDGTHGENALISASNEAAFQMRSRRTQNDPRLKNLMITKIRRLLLVPWSMFVILHALEADFVLFLFSSPLFLLKLPFCSFRVFAFETLRYQRLHFLGFSHRIHLQRRRTNPGIHSNIRQRPLEPSPHLRSL